MAVRNRWIPVAAVLALALPLKPAEARNPHCAGGIQYVVQGMRDKEKGNTEDRSEERRVGKECRL